MKNFIFLKWFFNRTVTVKVIIVFVASMVLALSMSVGRAIWSYQGYNQDVSQRQSAFSLDAIDGWLVAEQNSSLNYSVQLSKSSDIIRAVEQNNNPLLESAVKGAGAFTDLDFITVTDTVGNVLLKSETLAQLEDNLSGEDVVQSALLGMESVGYKAVEGNQFYIWAGAPIKNVQGQVIGTVSGGYDLSNNGLVDMIKSLYDTDVTIFSNDIRTATTIVKDGERLLGTSLDPLIAEIVLNQKQEY